MDEVIKYAIGKLKYDRIRPNQEAVVKGYLEGWDVLFCSPTGSGKSLTFEVAPSAFKFLHNISDASVIVVSPLVALMQYQAEGLQKKGMKAVYLQDLKTANVTTDDLEKGKCDVILASPESLLGEYRSLLTKLSNNKVLKAIFIDEAHCIKKFGRGNKKRKLPAYRPCYGQLGEIRSLVDGAIPVIALTATATKTTRDIIKKDLCLNNCLEIILNPGKPNVKYNVESCGKEVSENFKWLLDLLLQYGSKSPRIIVFFRQIKQIAEVYEYLETNLGMKQFAASEAKPRNGYWNRIFGMFHMTTNEKIKREICKSFQDERGCIRVVLSSTSFSMGLDVRDVHTVIHYGPANDIDDYLQESGRAGRDPTISCNAVILKYKYCLGSQNITPDMKNYVKAQSCRRLMLLQPFSEDTQSLTPLHSCCDICSVKCKCSCLCTNDCACSNPCSGTDSAILNSIRSSLSSAREEMSDSSSGEEFSSDSDIEMYMRRKPHVLTSSESD